MSLAMSLVPLAMSHEYICYVAFAWPELWV